MQTTVTEHNLKYMSGRTYAYVITFLDVLEVFENLLAVKSILNKAAKST